MHAYTKPLNIWIRASTMGRLTRGVKEKILAVLLVTVEVRGIILASMHKERIFLKYYIFSQHFQK
jgi:hypothetical protein